MTNFLKQNIKYIAVAVILIAVFFLGENLTPEEALVCENAKLKKENIFKKEAEIGAKDSSYELKNSLHSYQGDYYRLIFNSWADSDTKLKIKLASAMGGEFEVGSVDLEESSQNKKGAFKEFLFKTDGLYNSLVFEKDDHGNSAEVFVKNVKISRLNVRNEKELADLKPVIIGDTATGVCAQEQTEESTQSFPQLKSRNTSVGQIFKADRDYLSGVELDVVKIGSGGLGNYRLELRKVSDEEGNWVVNSKVEAYMEFSAEDLEDYSQKDGTEIFPLGGFLEKGRHYLVALNNSAVKTNLFNYLEIKGSSNDDAYADGKAVVYKRGKVRNVGGDLYFRIYGAKYVFSDGGRILTGAAIEDLGGGVGIYTYKAKNNVTDFLDLYSYTDSRDGFPLVRYNCYEGVVSGSPEKDAEYVYKINTIYPFKKLRLSAEQMYVGWHKVKIYYSYDNKKWTDILPVRDNDDFTQIFSEIIEGNGTQNEIYFKVTYDRDDEKDIKLFGLRNFSVTGELKTD